MADIQTALATRTLISDNTLISGNSVADSDFIFTIGGIRDDGLAATGTIVDASYGVARLNAQRHLMNQIFGDDGGTPTAITVNSSGELVVSSNSEYAEDTGHTSGNVGTFILTVRNDAGTALAADGDYSPLQVDSTGALRVTGGSASEYAEDSVHTSGDIGTFILAVRNDAGTALAADGDYSALQTDSLGRLRVAANVTVNSEYAEDTGHTSGNTGTYILAVRNDGFVSPVSANGDYSSLLVDSIGGLKVSQNPSLDGAIIDYTTASIAANTTSTNFAQVTATGGDLYVHSVMGSSSSPGKIEIQNSGTTVAVGFWSASTMMTQMNFPKPIIIASGNTLDIDITNRSGGGPAADFYATVIATQG